MNRIIFLFLLFVFCQKMVVAQLPIVVIPGSTPNNMALARGIVGADSGHLFQPIDTLRFTKSFPGLVVRDSASGHLLLRMSSHWVDMNNGLPFVPWSLTGNSNTNGGINFLGTNDNHPLRFRINGVPSGSLDSIPVLNTSLGYGSGSSIIDGTGNAYFGAVAGSANKHGSSNVGIGAFAEASDTSGNVNTVVGVNAMESNIDGSENVAIGDQALGNMHHGNDNVAIGASAGLNINGDNSTVHNNIMIGEIAEPLNPDSSFELSIGNWIYGEKGILTFSQYLNSDTTNNVLSTDASGKVVQKKIQARPTLQQVANNGNQADTNIIGRSLQSGYGFLPYTLAYFFGNSTTEGVGSSTTNNTYPSQVSYYANLNPQNHGHSGSTMIESAPNDSSFQSMLYWVKFVHGYKFIDYGINDLTLGHSLVAFLAAYRSSLDTLIAHGGKDSIIVLTPTLFVYPSGPDSALAYVWSDSIYNMAVQKGVKVVDAHKFMSLFPFYSQIDIPTGHPNDLGYSHVAQAVLLQLFTAFKAFGPSYQRVIKSDTIWMTTPTLIDTGFSLEQHVPNAVFKIQGGYFAGLGGPRQLFTAQGSNNNIAVFGNTVGGSVTGITLNDHIIPWPFSPSLYASDNNGVGLFDFSNDWQLRAYGGAEDFTTGPPPLGIVGRAGFHFAALDWGHQQMLFGGATAATGMTETHYGHAMFGDGSASDWIYFNTLSLATTLSGFYPLGVDVNGRVWRTNPYSLQSITNFGDSTTRPLSVIDNSGDTATLTQGSLTIKTPGGGTMLESNTQLQYTSPTFGIIGQINGFTKGQIVFNRNGAISKSSNDTAGATPARGLYATDTPVAHANNDMLYAADFQTNYQDAGFTGVKHIGIRTTAPNEYTADYSAQYDDRSLPDVGWVKNNTLQSALSSADLTAQTTGTTVVSYAVPSGSNHTFQIQGYINITAVSTDVIQLQCTYTDENSNSRTAIFFNQGTTTAGLSTVTNSQYSPLSEIRVKAGTTITLSATLTTGIGSITYDCGGSILQLR